MNAFNTLHDLELGSATSLGDLTVIPLLTDVGTSPSPSYLTLDEAIAERVAEITEVSEGGAVGQLRIKNGAKSPILILDGEELVGAKQNRIVNLTILVAAASTLEIPVTCVEAGRWGYRSRTFSSAGRAHYASARAMKLGQVSRSMATDGARKADQHAVWAHIAAKSERMHAVSETQAAAAMYERAQQSLDDFVRAFEPKPSQVGAVFAIRGVIAGLEVFDSPDTWRKQAAKVIRSYGLDVVDSPSPAGHRRGAREFIDALASLSVRESPAVGLGTDIRFEGQDIAGAALVLDGRVLHAVAFPVSS